MLYSAVSGETRLRHLAWNYDLQDEEFRDLAGWVWVDPIIEERTKFGLAEWLEANAIEEMAYGIDFTGDCFDSNHQYIPGPIGKGLTCATFVLGFLNSWQVRLLDLANWPTDRPEDLKFQTTVSKTLKEQARERAAEADFAAHIGHRMKYHAEIIEGLVGAARIRPEEVLIASVRKPTPSTHSDIEVLVSEVIEDIDRIVLEQLAKNVTSQ